jgi:hypothetical protein
MQRFIGVVAIAAVVSGCANPSAEGRFASRA